MGLEPQKRYQIAVETSSRVGSVTLGCGEVVIGSAQMHPPAGKVHKRVDLMPTIAQLCARFDVIPAQVDEIYVSIGPGSFTGLRNAVSTARTLALVREVRLVAVPTADVVVRNCQADVRTVVVCLNTKKLAMYTAIFTQDTGDSDWRPVGEPALRTPEQVEAAIDGPFAVLGDHLPVYDWREDVRLLDEALALPHSEVVWQLGRVLAAAGRYTPAMNLLPLYAREPEAVTLWSERQAKTSGTTPR